MRRYLLIILLVSGWITSAARAQYQYRTTPATPAARPEMPRTNAPVATEELARYAALNRQECALVAQFKLLSELELDHRKRAEEAAKGEQPARAKWEADLAQELAGKAAAIKQQGEELSKQRAAFEEAHNLPGPALNELRSRLAGGQNPDEAVYLAKLDEKLLALEQEVNATLDEGRTYAVQLSTNHVPEEVSNIHASIQENGRRLKELQKEQSDLELHKLQYLALRRR